MKALKSTLSRHIPGVCVCVCRLWATDLNDFLAVYIFFKLVVIPGFFMTCEYVYC